MSNSYKTHKIITSIINKQKRVAIVILWTWIQNMVYIAYEIHFKIHVIILIHPFRTVISR